MTRELTRLCVGQWWLFDSTDKADHEEAAAICDRCPAFAWCEQHLEQAIRLAPAEAGPTGTWAGRLMTDDRHRERDRKRTRRRVARAKAMSA